MSSSPPPGELGDPGLAAQPNERPVTSPSSLEVASADRCEGASRATPPVASPQSALNRLEMVTASTAVDEAGDRRGRALDRARAVRYRAGSPQMAELADAEQQYRRARLHLEALWGKNAPGT